MISGSGSLAEGLERLRHLEIWPEYGEGRVTHRVNSGDLWRVHPEYSAEYFWAHAYEETIHGWGRVGDQSKRIKGNRAHNIASFYTLENLITHAALGRALSSGTNRVLTSLIGND